MRTTNSPAVRHGRIDAVLYGVIVLLGSVLIVITSWNQPLNQNEWQQISAYDEPDLATAVSGTRQPPLGPLLGTLVQRVLADGHLEPRLVPMAAGIGCLLLMVVVLRGLDVGYAGLAAASYLAMAPVFLRFSAYARPYALPMMLMLVCVVAGSRWLGSGGRRWLALTIGAAIALPLSRVPEPAVFLAASAVMLTLAGLRRSLPRARAWPLAAVFLLPLVTIGVYEALTLARKTQQTSADSALLDLSPAHAVARLPAGLRELRDHVLPLHAEWFPWWPVVVLAVVLGLALAGSRRKLLRTWYWLPLALAPLVFLIAYHTVNAFPLEMRHYQIRFAYFWMPPLVILVAVLLADLARRESWRSTRGLAVLLAAALLVGQLPGTWRVLTQNDAVDFAQAGELVSARVPDDAVVIYDSAARTGWWRQPFFGTKRFLDDAPRVVSAEKLAEGKHRIPRGAPVYLLLLDSDCASATACDIPGLRWSGAVDGYHRIARVDRFTLYSPTQGPTGPGGAVRALRSLVAAFGVEWAVVDAVAAARLLDDGGRSGAASRLLQRVCRTSSADTAAATCREEVVDLGLGHLLEPD